MKVIRFIFQPSKYWPEFERDKSSWQGYFFKYALTFGLIGPVLSFISLKDIFFQKAIIYAPATYIADMTVLFVFSFLVSKLLKIDFPTVMKFYILVNIPIWLSDIFDIYQPLRVLSNLGFLYSFYLLYIGLKFFKKEKYILPVFVIHLVLYVLDAVLSEIIATNPILKKMLGALV